MARHVIFVPGLGDRMKFGQNIAIKYWRVFGLRPHYLPLGWDNKEGFEVKLQRLLDKVDELKAGGNQVSLVGVSAGASAVLNAYAESKDVQSVVLICGKINNPQTINRKVYEINPDFEESVYRAQNSLKKLSSAKRQNIMSIHPYKDQVVPIKDTIIDGAKEEVFPGWGHISGIFFGVMLGGPVISRFIKKAGKQ